ncbi:hypothetical protein PVAND_010169 [Polypedilum vanderplanki]|uniref:Histone-lysine N-methyltransferase trithorax n=1 Tax=Polypedilum vanderplanki TaxID=319348 RepID=A0A9J6CFV6_POLVA|nr:hypothetical protein PVAND_010169 [Polypedilum vanderplanki]
MFNKTKFPGKPSKVVNKKRVSVLSFDNNFDKRANDRCEIDSEKNLASKHGYQTESATTTTATAKQSAEESEEKSKPVMTTEETENKNLTTSVAANEEKMETNKETKNIKNDTNCDNLDKKTKNLKKHVTFRQTVETSDQCKVKRVYNPNFNGPIVSIIKKESLKYPILVYKTNCIVRPSKLTEIVRNSANNIDKLNSLRFGREYANQHSQHTSDGTNKSLSSASSSSSNVIVASKFNLPKLSANSSRVIKPNKRLLFDSGEDTSLASKKKVIKPSFWGEGGSEQSSSSSLLKEKKNFGFNFVDELDLKSKKSKVSTSLASTLPSATTSTLTTVTESTSKADDSSNKLLLSQSILRKPVLQLSTNFSLFGSQERDSSALKSPFSLKLDSSNNTSPSTSTAIFTKSLVCNVCNSITTRKQPRKYGAICCEICKKFMSKIIERVNKHPVQNWQCDKGDGSCTIESVALKNTKPSKLDINMKIISKGRCYACWLKKCLLTFQLPSPLKARLTNVLPKSLMEPSKSVVLSNTNNTNSDNSNIFLNSLKSFSSFKLSSNPLAINNFTFGSKPDIKSSFDNVLKNAFTSDKPLLVDIPKEAAASTSSSTPLLSTSETKKSPKSPKGSPKVVSPKVASISPSTSQQQLTNSSQNQIIHPSNVATSDSLRQRNLIKGPRVKHVCRSASLVLGLPIAVFPGDSESQNAEENAATETIVTDDQMLNENSEKENVAFTAIETKAEELIEPNKEKELSQKNEETNIVVEKVEEAEINEEKENIKSRSEIAINDLLAIRKIETADICKPITRKVTRPTLTLSQTQNATMNRISMKIPTSKRLLFNQHMRNNNSNLPPMISIDFWENYDPAEVSRTGFGLILSEKTPIKSVCFLCGSYGTDPLIFCVCCCEPYHFFCVENEFNVRFKTNSFLNTSSSQVNESTDDINLNISADDSGALVERGYDMPLSKRLNWLCPRCTVCYTCNMSTGVKVKCWKCEKNYHTTCLGTSKRLLGADRPLICASCLKCKSCGTTNVTKFIGNLAMCSNCFRLRRKGNYCPLCQKCYENNDYDVKMMECGDCKRWVHSKCEGLTDEQYNLLSVLPEHIEFICKKCSPNNSSSNIWRESVESEFKTSLLSVIKLLSKSRHACALLRLSPRKKNSSCFCAASKNNINGNNSYPTNFNSLFDALKTEDSIDQNEPQKIQCTCFNNNSLQMNTLKPNISSIKQSINDNKYHSLQAFNYDMNKILNDAQSEDLVIAYNEIISEIFPWYQNETKACTDALEETMNDHSKSDLLDNLICENENSEYFMMTSFNVPENLIKNETDYMQTIFFNEKDNRACMLCKKEGECSSEEEGRLLYCGHNTWVHTNCALWSAEVYEEIDGSLQNVHSAISRGRLIKCSKCGIKGATVGCNFKNCGEQYHFQCARSICEFRTDKSVYCPLHLSKETDEEKPQLESNFQVNRSVYVELDRRKKKTVEASKVQFLIGSLYVTKLGRIVPILSDGGDYLIPIDFECTRLFWSSKHPWNIVEYKIKISIQRSNHHTMTIDKGINFTVDHTKSVQAIQKNLKQIALFHSSIVKEQETMVQEETQDEEAPNQTNDLLPPEIKAAIFEDLPHDVLDGISMFDIFPNPADTKTTFFNHVSDEDDESSKSNQVNGDGDVDSDFNGLLNSIQNEFSTEYSFSKRDESESKKRKISNATENNDSNNNPDSKEQEQKSTSSMTLQKYINQQNELKNNSKDFIDKIPQLDGLNDEILMQSDGPVACEKCRCTYRNRISYERHLATCDNIQNTSESDSEAPDGAQVYLSNATSQAITGIGGNNVISVINQQQNQSLATSIPIVINNPLTTQNGLAIANGVQIPNLQNLSLTLGNDGNLCQNVIVDQQGQQIYTQPLQLGQFGQAATIMPIRNFNQANVINNGGISYLSNSTQQQPAQFIQLAPATNGTNTQQIMTITSQQDQEHQKTQKKPLLLPSPIKAKPSKAGNVIKNSSITTSKKKLETLSTKSQQQQISVVNSKNVQIANFQSSISPRTNSTQSASTISQPTSAQNIIFQQPAQQIAPQLNQYPLILNQNGQLVQYISTDAQNNQPIQYMQIGGTNTKDIKNGSQNFITNAQQTSTVASPQIFQNSFQMPANNSSNLVLTPNGLSVLPVVPQSPIVGTIIQQPQALQCVNGVVSTEQMMLGSTPTAIEMDPSSGCMYLTSQPVYYGLETIVQNTVMSSQQFVSTAMQGICQNSSFSATTTQVFQASKIEPIQMEIPAGYVFLNASDGSIHQSQIMDSSWNSIDEKKQTVEISGSYGNQKSQNVILKSNLSNQKTKVQAKVNKIQPQVVSKIMSPTSASINVSTSNINTTTVLKTVNSDNSTKMHSQQQQNIQIVNQNAIIAKRQKATYRTIGPKIAQEEVVKTTSSAALIKPKLKVQAKPIQQSNNYQSITLKPAGMNSSATPFMTDQPQLDSQPLQQQPQSHPQVQKITLDQTYRNVQNNIIVGNTNSVKPKIDNPSTSTVQTTVINLPTNVVNPIQQQNSIFNNLNSKNQNSSVKPHFQNRPTNRVLPMPANAANVATVKCNSNINKIGSNIGKANNQNSSNNNLSCANTGSNASLRNSSPSIIDNQNIGINNNVVTPTHNGESENYCEKIKSIAMELQSSNKADELFDALRRSTTINNVITISSSDNFVEKGDKKLKLSTPTSSPRSNDSYMIPSTSASSISSHPPKPVITKTASVCSLTKTIDSVATGANLLDDDQSQSVSPPIDLIPSSITITPIDPPLSMTPMEVEKPIITEEEPMETVDKINIESIMFEEMPELKGSKDTMSSSSEIITAEDEVEDMKIQEKSTFQTYDEETTSDRPSLSSIGSTYATKASREKTPTSTTSSKASGPKLLFEIQSQDGFTYKSTSINEIWEKLFETVQLARKAHGLLPLPEGRLNEMTGEQMLGLKTNALKYLLEQLPGVEKCTKYSPKYHRRNSSASSSSSASSFSSMNGNCSSMSGFYGSSSFSSNASNLSSNSSISASLTSLNQYINESDEILYENIYGCARFEPFSTRSDYDMFSWLASRHRLAPMPVHLQSNNEEVILRRGTGSNLPMAMKYRTLKETYKKSVGVYRSHIHGRGLFCTRDIEAGEMVIEYAGELIRSTLTDKRERYYDSKGIGCYMFKIDENLVVDATMSGTAARFINHSCDPNCYSKVVDILGQKHIIIFALRRIVTGEELTYDYKFDIEDNKIPCCCGAKRCRKYMN